MGQDQDNIVLAPYTTVMKRLLAVTYLQGVFASALSEDMTEYATDEITEILRRNHKLKASDEDDFTIRTQQELSTMLNSARLYCRNISGSGRYRYHEYYVRIRHRTYP